MKYTLKLTPYDSQFATHNLKLTPEYPHLKTHNLMTHTFRLTT